jgi:Type II CAAX prenyl endopeptidase Rce1-like
MTTRAVRTWNLVEALAFSALVGRYIWQLQESVRFSWIVFPIWLGASLIFHKDNPKTLGWRADNLWSATKRAAIIFVPCILVLCATGIFPGALNRPANHLLAPKHFFGYLAFCLLQQVGLSSYSANRLFAATGSEVRTSLIAGALFGALHWPNPVLIPLTCIGGAAMAWLFVRERNILPLALFQGILGTLVWWAFPVAWHHAMRVGPGFYHFHPQ